VFVSCKKENLGKLGEVSKEFSQYSYSSTGEAVATYIGKTAIRNETTFAAYFQAQLKDPSAGTTKIKASIEQDLLSIYDSLFSVKSLTFPDKAFKLRSEGEIVIESGKLVSDSVKLDLLDATGLIPNSVYVIPIKLTVESGSAVLKGKYIFLKMKIVGRYVLGSMESFSNETNFYNSSFGLPYLLGQFQNTSINGINNASKNLSISIKINESVPKDLLAEIIPDQSKSSLDFFNKNRGGNAKLIPENAYKIVKNRASIKANEYSSQDSFKIEFDYSKLQETSDSTSYLLILKMDNTGNPDLLVSDTSKMANLAFIQIKNKIISTGNVASTNDGLTGSTMLRTKWIVSSSGGNEDKENPGSNVLDGKISTFWRAAKPSPQDLIINMTDEYTVKGFLFTPQYNNMYESFNQTKVYSSKDGKTWEFQGYFLAGYTNYESSAEKPDIKTLRFIKPVQAKYFKFQVIDAGYGNPAIAEINAIQ